MKVTVLRLGHRHARDKRISTHVGLTARAFGASELVFDVKDTHVVDSIERITKDWGGCFTVSYTPNWRKYVSDFNGERIHLTMYGLNVNDVMKKVDSKKDKLVIIGGQKVPSEIYKMVDFNIAIGNQPHSEVAALAVFLDRLQAGKELGGKFHGKKNIIPQAHGKKVVEDKINRGINNLTGK